MYLLIEIPKKNHELYYQGFQVVTPAIDKFPSRISKSPHLNSGCLTMIILKMTKALTLGTNRIPSIAVVLTNIRHPTILYESVASCCRNNDAITTSTDVNNTMYMFNIIPTTEQRCNCESIMAQWVSGNVAQNNFGSRWVNSMWSIRHQFRTVDAKSYVLRTTKKNNKVSPFKTGSS